MALVEEANFENNNYLNIDDLYAWIDTIPLSRPKRNIARDFADGVLVAEVIANFIPKWVDLHNYPAVCSPAQRKVNWQTLNRRVLSKMGIKISEDTITQLVDSKPYVIEQVLTDIREKIEYLRTTTDWKVISRPAVRRSKSVGQARAIRHGHGMYPSQPYEGGNLRGRTATATSVDESRGILIGRNLDRKSNRSNLSLNFGKKGTSPHVISIVQDTTTTDMGPSLNDDVNTHTFVVSSGQTRSKQQTIMPPVNMSTSSLVGADSVTASKSPEDPPCQIMYRGHKMVPLQFLDEKEKEMKILEATNRSLTQKIFRLETLLNIKDQRIEDLSHQHQNLRGMYERLTESTFSSLAQ